MLSSINSVVSVVIHLPCIHYITAFVCIIGVFIAWLSDPTEDTKLCASTVLESLDAPQENEVDLLCRESVVKNILLWASQTHRCFQNSELSKKVCKKVSDLVSLTQFLWAAKSMKYAAKSRRQFSYMLEKYILGLPIEKDETEMKSYLDVKRYVGKQFPFMWKVSDVKSPQIECEGNRCHPMSSYSYLDLIRNLEVQEAAITAAREYSSGNHGPRMLGGNTRILVELESVVSNFFGREGTLLCASGFLACMSCICAVAHENDIIFSDSKAHASLRSGMKLSGGKVVNFKHDDYVHAEKLVRKHRKNYQNAWMVIESVYSMDGDIANLPAAHAICTKYDIGLVIDEAHGLGVLGKTGRGLEEHFNMPKVATIICGTFSKSIGSIGGYISGSKDLIDFMDFHAPGNVFSAPLPAYCAGAAIKAFELIDRESWRIATAVENSIYLRHALTKGHWPAEYDENDKYEIEGNPATTVIPIVFVDDIDRIIRIAGLLRKNGYMVTAVSFPACPFRRPRFRITATAAYTRDLINNFAAALVSACVQEGPSEARNQLKLFSSIIM